MQRHFKILVEYDPKLPVSQRENVDRYQIKRLTEENPGFKIVTMARRLVEDNRAELFAVMEPNAGRN